MAEKSCPNCKHPMMEGPLIVGREKGQNHTPVTAAWWCANCHFFIEQDPEKAPEYTR